MIFSKYLLRHALSGKNCIGYYKNYDDHIKRLKDEIKDAEDTIEEIKQEIEEYKEEIAKVEAEKNAFETSDYIPSTVPKSINEDQNKMAYDKIKEHELKYHKNLVGNFIIMSNNGYRGHYKVKMPSYEYVSSDSQIGNIKYIICKDCRKKNKEKHDERWTMCVEHEAGSSS